MRNALIRQRSGHKYVTTFSSAVCTRRGPNGDASATRTDRSRATLDGDALPVRVPIHERKRYNAPKLPEPPSPMLAALRAREALYARRLAFRN